MGKVAVAQIKSSTVKKENLDAALGLINEAKIKGAGLIVFPEFLMAYSPANQSAEELSDLAESVDGPFITSLREAAKATGVGVVATIPRVTRRPCTSSMYTCVDFRETSSPQ